LGGNAGQALEKQRRHSNLHNHSSQRMDKCRSILMDNKDLYQHILECHKNCWCHHIILKYMESMYPYIQKKRKKKNGKRESNICYEINTLSSYFSVYVLKR